MMNKLNKVVALFAAAALAVPMVASAQNVQPAPAKPIATPSAEELKFANGTDQCRGDSSQQSQELCQQ
jgi:hypothetical protein